MALLWIDPMQEARSGVQSGVSVSFPSEGIWTGTKCARITDLATGASSAWNWGLDTLPLENLGTAFTVGFWYRTSLHLEDEGIPSLQDYAFRFCNSTNHVLCYFTVKDLIGYATLGVGNDRAFTSGLFSFEPEFYSTHVLNLTDWNFIEISVSISGSTTCRLNGRVNNRPWHPTTTFVDAAHASVSNTLTNMHFGVGDFQDVYIQSGFDQFLGDHHIRTCRPSANGAHSEWSPNSGTDQFAPIDEAEQDSDTTYLSTSVAGDRSMTEHSNLDTSVVVKGLQVGTWARNTAAGTSSIAMGTRQSGTDYFDATAVAVTSTSYAFKAHMLEDNPATATDWTDTEVNAAQFGFQSA